MNNIKIDILNIIATKVGYAVLLKSKRHKRVLPIFIGPFEAHLLSLSLENEDLQRPFAHNLIQDILTKLNSHVTEIHINDYNEGVYYAEIFCETSSSSFSLDARPSDALILAGYSKVPIYIDKSIYMNYSIPLEVFENEEISNGIDMEMESFNKVLHALSEISRFSQELDKESQATPSKNTVKNKKNKKIQKFQSKKEVLKQMLEVAIHQEKYEEAARLRDEIKKIKKLNDSNKK